MDESLGSTTGNTLVPPANGDSYNDSDLERAIEQGEMSRIEARHYAGERALASATVGDRDTSAQPKLAKPQAEIRHEPKLRGRTEPKDWRTRMAADQPPTHMRKPQFGHDPYHVA
jgi:hypothetical protein